MTVTNIVWALSLGDCEAHRSFYDGSESYDGHVGGCGGCGGMVGEYGVVGR